MAISEFTVSNNGIALDDVIVAVIVGIACDCVTVAAEKTFEIINITTIAGKYISLLRFAETQFTI